MKYEISEKKAAVLLGVSESRISQLVSDGRLDYVTIRGNIRISKESIEEYRANGGQRRGRPPKSTQQGIVRYTLMSANYEIASVLYDSLADYPISVVDVIDAAHAPIGVFTRSGKPKKRDLNDWWLHRSIPRSRPELDAKLLSLGIESPIDLPAKSMGLSLSDCYWLRPEGSPQLKWEEVNYFENDFAASDVENWDSWLSGVGLNSPDNTSEGELPKRWVADNGVRYLLKGCRSDDQRPYNEAVATALHRRLLDDADFVSYDIVKTAEGPASRCADFLSAHEEYVPAIYVKNTVGGIRGKSTYDRFCKSAASLCLDATSVRSALSKMIICDAILANSDRHWRNFGFIRDVDSLDFRPAPLFDTGNSLWYAKTDREIEAFNWTFIARPFAVDVHEQLAYVDDLSWFDPNALRGFADEACEILSESSHANHAKRIDFIREGLNRNISLVIDAAKILMPRIERQR